MILYPNGAMSSGMTVKPIAAMPKQAKELGIWRSGPEINFQRSEQVAACSAYKD